MYLVACLISISHNVLSLQTCLNLDADLRPNSADLLKHDFFCRDGFSTRFIQELKVKVAKENEKKPLIQKSSAKSEQSSDSASGSKKKKGKEGATKLTRKVSKTPNMSYKLLSM